MSSTNVDNVQMDSVINTVFWRVKTEPEVKRRKEEEEEPTRKQ